MFKRKNIVQREAERVRTEATGSCRTGRGFEWQISFEDISSGGCRVDDPRHGMELGAHVNLFIAGSGPHSAEVAWRQGDRVGLEFHVPLPDKAVEHLEHGEWEEARFEAENQTQRFPIRRVV